MAGDQMPVLTLDIDESKIKALEEVSEKFKAAFNVGPGGLPMPSFGRSPRPGNSKYNNGENEFIPAVDRLFKGLNKESEGTLKTFRQINKTLSATTSKLKYLFTTTVSWGAKIAAIGGGGMFGYGYMAQRVSEQYQQSQGLNMTNGQKQAAESVYGARFSFVQSTMDALAKGQYKTSAEYRALRSLGLDPLRSPGENLPKFISAVDQIRKQYGDTALAALEARGVNWVGTAGLNEIRANSDRLPLFSQQYTERSQQLDKNLSSETQRDYQDTSSSLIYNSDRIKTAWEEAIGGLNPQIRELSSTVTNGVEDFLKGDNFKWIVGEVGKGLTDLSLWLNSEQFKTDMKDFATSVGTMARAIGMAIKWLSGKLPGVDLEEGNPESNNAVVDSLIDALVVGGGAYAGAKVGGLTGAGWGAYAAYLYNDRENIWDSAQASWDYTKRNVGDALSSVGVETDLGRRNVREVRQWPEWANVFHGGRQGPIIRQGNSNGVVFGSNIQADIPGGSGAFTDNYSNNPNGRRLARGIRNNNPGNLKFVGQYGAVLEDGIDASHAKFTTMSEGISALERQIGLYLQRGRNTINSIFDIYSEENKESYKGHVSRVMGIGRDDVISFSDDERIFKLIKSIISMENGKDARYISDADIRNAMAIRKKGDADSLATIRLQVEPTSGADISTQVKGMYITPRY